MLGVCLAVYVFVNKYSSCHTKTKMGRTIMPKDLSYTVFSNMLLYLKEIQKLYSTCWPNLTCWDCVSCKIFLKILFWFKTVWAKKKKTLLFWAQGNWIALSGLAREVEQGWWNLDKRSREAMVMGVCRLASYSVASINRCSFMEEPDTCVMHTSESPASPTPLSGLG